MESPTSQRRTARFGMFEADLDDRVLTKSGVRVRMQDQPFQILALLLENPGKTLTREELQEKLWPGDTFVEFDAGLNTAMKKLRTALGDSAESPRFIETIPRRGYRFVAPVSFPAEVSAAAPSSLKPLPGPLLERSIQDPAAAPQGPRRWPFWVVAAALFVGAALGAYWYFGGPRKANRDSFSVQANMRPSVAVLGFRNSSGNPNSAWLSTAFSEMLSTELAADEKLRTIPGENISRMKADFALGDSDGLAPDTLGSIRQNLNADFVVLGSYFDMGQKSGGSVRMDLRLQDARTGETVASVTESGTEVGLPDMASRAGAELRRRLGAGQLSPAQTASATLALPSSPEASRLYSEGLNKLRAFDALGARDRLQDAIAAEPNFALAHVSLSDALSAMGYDLKSREEAKRAFDLSGGLSREQRLWIEAHYRALSHDWVTATDTYRKLFILFPDNLEYGLKLAGVQTTDSKAQDALTTVDSLRHMPAPISNDPRIDNAEADARLSLGDFAHAEAADATAASKGRTLGAKLLAANARHHQCWALQKLGRAREASSACEEAKRIFGEAGDRVSVASLLVTMGSRLHEQGDLSGARSNYEAAIPVYRAVGAQGGLATALNNLAIVTRIQGDYASAKKMYRESIAISRNIGDKDGLVLALGNLGSLLVHEGDLKGARDTFQELLVACREIGSKARIALQLDNYGQTIFLQGDLLGAQKAIEEARTLDTESGEKRQKGYDVAALGDLFEAKDDLPQARRMREEALKIRTELGDKGDAAVAQVALAQSAMEEGHPRDALNPLRDAVKELDGLKAVDDEVTAYATLSRALLLAGDPVGAAKAIDNATAIESKSHDRGVHFTFAIADARVRAANGKSKEATEILRTSLKEISKDGFAGLAFEIRLALAEIELGSGKTASARQQLQILEQEASAKGYSLIARKARTARA